ncbi:protein Aster-B isoform X6 [Rhinatrema bivittatum]|uniref:protein Aster-B isoform X6 n=1 Tax=Rhinatrema bivittatum TaxID=194408 RepID=UPI001129DC41|nr:protein Aster-B isoform X6 [Rhinatrema bivittatum]
MPAANMTETLQLPALQVPEPVEYGGVWSSNSTPSLRRRRFKMRRTKKIQGEKEQSLEAHRCQGASPLPSAKEFLQLPSIEITPSSDEEMLWSGCSTPSTSPRRKRFLLKKWIRVREKKELSESRTDEARTSGLCTSTSRWRWSKAAVTSACQYSLQNPTVDSLTNLINNKEPFQYSANRKH